MPTSIFLAKILLAKIFLTKLSGPLSFTIDGRAAGRGSVSQACTPLCVLGNSR